MPQDPEPRCIRRNRPRSLALGPASLGPTSLPLPLPAPPLSAPPLPLSAPPLSVGPCQCVNLPSLEDDYVTGLVSALTR